MSIGLTAEHRLLAESVEGFCARHAPPAKRRAELAERAPAERPAFWDALVAQGLHAAHLAEAAGGAGYGIVELAVVLEATGKALLPGPLLPTVLTSALVPDDAFGRGATAATALTAGGLSADGCVLNGTVDHVLGAPQADVLLLAARCEGRESWFVVRRGADGLVVTAQPSVDLTRGIGSVRAHDLAAEPIPRLSTGRVRDLAAVLIAAEAVGLARWCFEAALEHVKLREQFGRPVGSFQAVKHKCARMFARLETIGAAAWDAARSVADGDAQLALAASEAALICPRAARDIALESLTLMGGMGFTWDHDLHLYERRSLATAQLLAPYAPWARRLGSLVTTETRSFDVELVGEDPAFRAEVAAALRAVDALPEPKRRARLVELGYVAPHYPPPYGLGATPAQQVVIAQELRKAAIPAPTMAIGEWALPTILERGTQAQKDRFVLPTMRGELVWCQLYSEPNAGSDLAALTTRAVKVEGGWRLNGQKVWTSAARDADWGMCLARTDPERPKHEGISYLLLDMRSPGVLVRPLRQATGAAKFAEVFFEDVLVPDDCLVGEPGEGWKLARGALVLERLNMARRAAGVDPLENLHRFAEIALEQDHRADVLRALGEVVAERYALAALSLREALQLLGGETGAAASVMKVSGALNDIERARTSLEWMGPAAASLDGAGGEAALTYLGLPATLIGGGTIEIQLNVIGERILGLPRA